MDIIGGRFFCVVIVAYTLARCYFLVEALVSLRHLPAGAYRQVDWSHAVPTYDLGCSVQLAMRECWSMSGRL
jgi:hypothetical protein